MRDLKSEILNPKKEQREASKSTKAYLKYAMNAFESVFFLHQKNNVKGTPKPKSRDEKTLIILKFIRY